MSGQEAVLQMVILRDGMLVGTEVFTPGTYRLGSAPQMELRLEDPTVQVLHATIYFQNGKAVIQDNSRGALLVNGRPVSVCEVRPLDEIRCGPFALKGRIVPRGETMAKPKLPPEVEALLRGAPAPVSNPPVRLPIVQGRAEAKPAQVAAIPPPAVPLRPVGPSRLQEAPARPAPALTPAPAGPKSSTGSPQRLEVDWSLTPMPEEFAAAIKNGAARKAQPHPVPSPAPAHRKAAILRVQESPSRQRGPSRLYFEVRWGRTRQEARSFGPDKKPVIAGTSKEATLPLWGFSLPGDAYPIAHSTGRRGYRLFIPPHARLERWKSDGRFYPPAPSDVETDGVRNFIHLSDGMAVRLSEGQMSLLAYVAPRPERPFVNPLRGLPWLFLAMLALLTSGVVYWFIYGPKAPEIADFVPRNVPPVALRLITPVKPRPVKPIPKKIEEAKPEPVKEAKVAEPRPVVTHRKTHRQPREVKPEPAPPPPPESKAMQALAKLSAAGPATGNILAAVDKLGSGPGSKNTKNSNYKLSGLIGKSPIANAGLGTFGLGGGGKGGGGLLGREILRGKGGGGIGALGAGSVGRGTVAGTVSRASARTISATGSVDREAVARTVNAHLQEVRACYERALLKEPGLAGKVVLEWTISLSGEVATAKTKTSTLHNSAVESCILQDLKSWRFPPAKGGLVIVSYPFLFNSVGY